MKKTLAVLLSVLLIIAVLPLSASAMDPVNYIDENGILQTVSVYDTVYSSMNTTWANGWYVVTEDVTISSRITVNSTVNLLLCDGATLTCSRGINVKNGNTLNIFGQVLSTGILIAGPASSSCAGIGGDDGQDCGTITINGGVIEATSGYWAAGIGGGAGGSGGLIIINGGKVHAAGSNSGGTGIGGCKNASIGDIRILKGTVNAENGGNYAAIGGGEYSTGGSITISGGNVTATATSFGAAIGSGSSGNCGTITISGGTVNATSTVAGAAIGTGRTGAGGIVHITGGDITAISNNCGIGGGDGGYADSIVIDGGTVIAQAGSNCAGIGGNSATQTITINDGHITATGGQSGAGIGGNNSSTGGTITFNGGVVDVYGGQGSAAIGAGYASNAGDIYFNGGQITTTKHNQDGFGVGAAYARTGGTVHFNLTNASDFVLADNYHVTNDSIIFDHTHYIYGTSTQATASNITGNKVVKNAMSTPIHYIDESGDDQICSSYNTVIVSTEAQTWTSGWYAATSDITLNSRITVSGNVSLILCDGAEFKARKGITVNEGNSLTIYSQEDGLGALTVDNCENYCAAIGASGSTTAGNNCGSVTINGGIIKADAKNQSNQYGAGIGGSKNGNGGNITINGGEISAKGADSAAGIGGGLSGTGGNIEINGGSVEALGSSRAAGIGGGGFEDADTVIINGGTVNANGGENGAGIGGGWNSGFNSIIINGGNVNAVGGLDASGIGIGKRDSASSVINQGDIILGWTSYSDSIYASSCSKTVEYSNEFYFNDNGQLLKALGDNIDGRLLKPIVFGDLDSSGDVEFADYAVIKNIVTGNVSGLTDVQLLAADYYYDTAVDAFDMFYVDKAANSLI